jgi:hypothetical protein
MAFISMPFSTPERAGGCSGFETVDKAVIKPHKCQTMIRVTDLLSVADDFRSAAGLERESTLSHRIFGDTKVLARLRQGGEITVGRFNAAMQWLVLNWPDGSPKPAVLSAYPPPQEDAA